MYDDGNYLYGDGSQIEYTHTQLLTYNEGGMSSSAFVSDGVVYTGSSASVHCVHNYLQKKDLHG